ncbi:bud site selection protein 3 [[Candida] railenensis]|uniref:Bud site selection protein 3 n=1 Tax=[Candida] railenensis TaxID=45579 RepID=A0A9P0VVM0_9ASCO|nr:bud site selection protein 3 [[Candida] railenensis]
MEVYKRYASREHDVPLLGTKQQQQQYQQRLDDHFELEQEQHQTQNKESQPQVQLQYDQKKEFSQHELKKPPSDSGIKLNLLLAQPGDLSKGSRRNSRGSISAYEVSTKTNEEWLKIFPHAAYFTGEDSFFGNIIIMVYENPTTNKTCTTSFTQFGSITYENLILDARSRFWPSCENLLPVFQKSNVRRALAISNLKNYNRVANSAYGHIMKSHWDETTAGNLANNMKLITEQTPNDLGLQLLKMGLLQTHVISSSVLDIVYDNTPSSTNANIIEENNKMVFLLGNQLDQLFDPLLEYSPEALEIMYKPPPSDNMTSSNSSMPSVMFAIIEEILTVQTNYTMGLVSLLQDFIIPLRIHVLSAASNAGISKINQVFPPTIDEVTRINCILLDSLVKGSKFGVQEVFKVMGMILPYFYKPFIRHEANLKQFAGRLNRFHSKNVEKIFENEQVNKGKYSVREIDSIVCGSLLELSKIKMIMTRLYDTVTISKGHFSKEDLAKMELYYKAIVGVVDAFGFEEPSDQEATANKKRIFTPTGKILSEVASKWPIELQYGWLTRKVVGIFELQNVKPRVEEEIIDVLIIFSDHLLFLTIKDMEYTSKMIAQRRLWTTNENTQDSVKMLSISDILMHAMVNEKPLPESLPSMEVNCWCEMNEATISSYKAGDDEHYLRFFITSNKGFREERNEEEEMHEGDEKHNPSTFSKNYKVFQREIKSSKSNHEVFNSAQVIIDLINKAKILNKSQPFHLFKTLGNDLTMYSTAHDLSVYEMERCKSPFALFLNLSPKQVGAYFNHNKDLFLIMNASFINSHQLQFEAYNRIETFSLSEIIEASHLKDFVLETVSKGYISYINFYNETLRYNLIQSYHSDLNFFLNSFVNHEFALHNQYLVKSEDYSRSVKTKESNMNVSAIHSIPDVYVEKFMETSKRPRSTKRASQDGNDHHIASKKDASGPPPLKKRKKSFFRKIFGGLFKSKNAHATTQNMDSLQQVKPRTDNSYIGEISKDDTSVRKQIQENSVEQSQKQSRPYSTVGMPTSTSKQELEERLPSHVSTIRIPKSDIQKVDHLYQPHPEIKKQKYDSKEAQVKDVDLKQGDERNSYIPQKLQNEKISVPIVKAENSENTPEVTSVPVFKSLEPYVATRVQKSQNRHSIATTTPTNAVRNSVVRLPPQSNYSSNKYTVIPPTDSTMETESILTDVTAHPFRVPQSSKNSIDSKSVISRKHRSLTEENVLVLDGLHSHSYRTRLNKLLEADFSKAFQEDLYNDGESNWTKITRENSSLFNAEINALKEDADMDTEDVIEIPSSRNSSNNARYLATSRNASDGSTLGGSDNSNRIISGHYAPPTENRILSGSSLLSNNHNGVSIKRDISVSSLTSSQMMEEFTRDIDSKFAHLDIITEDSYYEDSNQFTFQPPPIDQQMIEKAKQQDLTNASSKYSATTDDEEFYSPNEFEEKFEAKSQEQSNFISLQRPFLENPHASRHLTTNSISSEVTMTNENNNQSCVNSDKTKEIITVVKDKSDSEDILLSDFPHNPDSYLSELLDGTLRFDYDLDDKDEGPRRNEDERKTNVQADRGTASRKESPPIFQSPSLTYLASYIRSGKTIPKDMDRIITGEPTTYKFGKY